LDIETGEYAAQIQEQQFYSALVDRRRPSVAQQIVAMNRVKRALRDSSEARKTRDTEFITKAIGDLAQKTQAVGGEIEASRAHIAAIYNSFVFDNISNMTRIPEMKQQVSAKLARFPDLLEKEKMLTDLRRQHLLPRLDRLHNSLKKFIPTQRAHFQAILSDAIHGRVEARLAPDHEKRKTITEFLKKRYEHQTFQLIESDFRKIPDELQRIRDVHRRQGELGEQWSPDAKLEPNYYGPKLSFFFLSFFSEKFVLFPMVRTFPSGSS
jgi:hypothetical protein